MKELNKYITNPFAKLRSFPGVKIKLNYYVVPSLTDETQNRILIHGGCNGISNKTSTQEKIANEVLEMTKTCRGYGVNDVLMSSSVICRRNFWGEVKCVIYYTSKFTEKKQIYTFIMELLKQETYSKAVYIF